MRLRLVVLFALTAFLLTLAQSLAAKVANDDQTVGTWSGNSTCVERNGPCHDEVNVYHISKIAEKPNSFLVTGSKVVEGKEIVMGTGEWTYDAQKHTLSSEIDGRIFKLTIDGNKMEGTLTWRGSVYRKISLKKEK